MTNKIINIALNIIIFIIPLLIVPIGITSIPYNILKISVLLLCGLILFISLIFKRKEIKFDSIDKILIIFYAFILISTIFSINKKKAIIGEMNRFEGILTFTIYFLTYYCAKYYFTPHKYMRIFSMIVVTISSIIGILQYYNIFPIYFIFDIPYKKGFASSTFGNSNFFGNFLAIVVPVFLALYIIKNKKAYLIISLISFWAMLISIARSSWVALILTSFIGIIYIIKNINKDIIKRTFIIIISFILIFLFVIKPPQFLVNILPDGTILTSFSDRIRLINSEFEEVLEEKELSGHLGSGRIAIWSIVIKAIITTPIIGSGPDTLADLLLQKVPFDMLNYIKSSGTYIDKAHNEYLQIAATIGIPALIVYILFLVQIITSQKNAFKNNEKFILLIPILSYIIQAFFNISTIGVAPIFWLLLGLIQNEQFLEKLKE